MPVVHQHRRLKKWTRGGKAIDIIPDSNYTRVENRKKRNHPKNINYTREGRMEKDIRTESASSSDSYLSRYLASRNSTPGTSRCKRKFLYIIYIYTLPCLRWK